MHSVRLPDNDSLSWDDAAGFVARERNRGASLMSEVAPS